MKKDEADAKSVCLIFAFDGSTRAPQARSPWPMGKAKKKRDLFLNHQENRVKSQISTMVFLGERKSILPGAEAAADKDLLLCTQQMERRAEEAKAEADLEGFPASLFLIVLADREEKSKLKKGQPGLKPVSNNGFASTTNPRAKFSRTCTT